MGLTTRHHRTPSHCSITATDHHGGWDVVLDMIHISTSSNTNSRQCDTTLPITLASQLLISFYLNLSDNYFTNDRDKYISRLLKCYGVSNLTLSSVLNFYCDHINTSTSNTSLKYFVLLGSRLCHPLLPIVFTLPLPVSCHQRHQQSSWWWTAPCVSSLWWHNGLSALSPYLPPDCIVSQARGNNHMWYRYRRLRPALSWPWVSKSVYPCAGILIQALVRRRTSWLSAQEK